MDEKTLFWAALLCTISGIIAVSVLSSVSETGIGEIAEMPEGSTVKITGMVITADETPKTIKMNISNDEGSVTAIAFKNDASWLSSLPESGIKGKKAEIRGKVSLYNGNKEVIADSVRLLGTA